jgi:hypothetical protein
MIINNNLKENRIMSNTEEIIKNETNKFLNQAKEKIQSKGGIFTETDEFYFKMGIKYGIVIAGMALAGTNVDNL